MTEGREVKKASVGGVEVAYRFDGPAEGRVVMLSNSLMTDHTMWDINMPALAERYRVLRYDTRGHGGSEATPGPYSLELLAEDAVGLLDSLGIAKVHFVGLSVGGMIGQQIGARFPERVYSLALCDTASEWRARTVWDERFAIVAAKGIAGLVDSTITRWFTAEFIRSNPNTIDTIRRMIARTSQDGYLACGAAIRELAQTTMLLKIKTPTLVLVGRKDPACTVENATVIHRLIAGSKLVIIEDAAHLSNIEQPAAVNTALRNFLDGVDKVSPET